jgi:hypothetical protein
MLKKNIIKFSLHFGTMEGSEDTAAHVLHARTRWTCGQLHVPFAFTLGNKPRVLNKEELIPKQDAKPLALILCLFLFHPSRIMGFFSLQ